jgi:hypothetical protein
MNNKRKMKKKIKKKKEEMSNKKKKKRWRPAHSPLLWPMALLGLCPQDGSHFSSCPEGDHWHQDHPGQWCPESCDRNSHSGTGSKTPFHPTHRVCTHV